VTTDPRDPAFIEPAYVTCKACLGEGFVDVGELVETCFGCNGEGVFEL
jgi:DnaJ-class molecular chaperone